jgi:protein-disulfide isomerase
MSGREEIKHLLPPVNERDHVRGPKGGALELVEYGDYQCEDTGEAHLVLRQLLEAHGDQIRFVFRNYPLRAIHEDAEHAAQAAEAAAAQGKFWEMHDILLENQGDLSDKAMERYARMIGLDLERFRSDLGQGIWAPRVQEDVRSAHESGVEQTPTFFLNGRSREESYSMEELVRTIEHAVQVQSGA